MPASQTIGTYETKTRLAEILRQVQQGQGFVITQRGLPVAELLPTGTAVQRAGMAAAEKMKLFAQAQPVIGADIDLKSLMNDGRD